MKSLNVKRIAALVATLAIGLASAAPVTFQNVQIINNQGQPVVQIVVGSKAAITDGVVAANIAAVIGNLAFTSTPVTATVSGQQNLHCVVTSTACSLTNKQVELGVRGLSAVSGSYSFSALIGSVLNRAVKMNLPQYTKIPQSGTGTQYAYPETYSTQTSPAASPYTAINGAPTSIGVTPTYNGGGVSFTTFTNSSYDNIMRITPQEVPSLASNFGVGNENEYLWVTGFPVYDQNAKSFALIDAGGAVQAVFQNPIQFNIPANTMANTTKTSTISLLGENWTIISGNYPTAPTGFTSGNVVFGYSKLEIAQSLTPLQVVYVGHNITSGPFMVELQDLSYPTQNGTSKAALAIYYKGQLVNETAIPPYTLKSFNISGTKLYVRVGETFPGLYAYQKWAQLQLYSNVYNLTSGQAFNSTYDKGWYVLLGWTNTTTSTNAKLNELQQIVIYNTTPVQTLTPQQSFNFISNPAVWKLTFVGETQGSGNFDPVTFTTSYVSSKEYENLGLGSSKPGAPAPKNITEPAQLLTVTSSIPNAFSYMGESNNTVVYDLTPYELNEVANAMGVNSLYASAPINVSIEGIEGSFIGGASNPNLFVTLTGYPSNTATTTLSKTLSFTSQSGKGSYNTSMGSLFNVTNIKVSEALPGLTVNVNSTIPAVFNANLGWNSNTVTATNVPALGTPANALAYITVNTLINTANVILFSGSGKSPLTLSFGGNVEVTSNTLPVNTAISSNTMVLSGQVDFGPQSVPIYNNSNVLGYVTLSGNVVFNNINDQVGYTPGNAISNSIPVSGNILLSYSGAYLGNILLSGNVVLDLEIPANALGSVTPTQNAIVISANTYASGNIITDKGLAQLNSLPVGLFYQVGTTPYPYLTTSTNVLYNQQNGQPIQQFVITPSYAAKQGEASQYFTYQLSESPIPGNTAANDYLGFAIYNSTAGASAAASNLFQLNYSLTGQANNMTYISTIGANVQAPVGFRTEKGSEVASISPTSLTVDLAKGVDTLGFVVGPVNATTATLEHYYNYTVGQTLANIGLPNVTVANVTAKCVPSTTSCQITNVTNLTATPSVSQAYTRVPINTATNPLVVLDKQANNASNLIVIGSYYVNSVAAQIFNATPTLKSSFGPGSVIVKAFGTNRILIAGYTANETIQAGNEFINMLLSNASV